MTKFINLLTEIILPVVCFVFSIILCFKGELQLGVSFCICGWVIRIYNKVYEEAEK